jgi:DNA-directed RNA polymerase specialized sigma24 family protein
MRSKEARSYEMSQDSVTIWIDKLREGDATAAQQLWETYYRRLVGLARRKLDGRARVVADEEDVALSAFKSFCRGIERGRFPQVSDRRDLWNLLVTITLRKVLRLVRDEGREKRGGSRRAIATTGPDGDLDLLQQIISAEPTPEIATQMVEEAEHLLGRLPNEELVELALLKMEGYTNAEIAERWQKAERTVERKLNVIRQLWLPCERPGV